MNKNKRYYFLIFMVSLLTPGCQEAVKRPVPADEVSINETENISVSDSVFFISGTGGPYTITPVTAVPEATLYYALPNAPFKQHVSQTVTIQEQDTVLQYFLTKKNFANSAVKTIVFPKHARKFLNKINPVTNPDPPILQVKVADKSRGVISLEVYTVSGARVLKESYLKQKDELIMQAALDNYPSGIYILLLKYGKDAKPYKILKL